MDVATAGVAEAAAVAAAAVAAVEACWEVAFLPVDCRHAIQGGRPLIVFRGAHSKYRGALSLLLLLPHRTWTGAHELLAAAQVAALWRAAAAARVVAWEQEQGVVAAAGTWVFAGVEGAASARATEGDLPESPAMLSLPQDHHAKTVRAMTRRSLAKHPRTAAHTCVVPARESMISAVLQQ